MMNLKEAFSKLTPSTAVSLLAAVLTVAVAFGAPLTTAQTNSVLVLGGAVSLVLLAHGLSRAFKYLSPQSVIGLVTAVIGVAVAFGLPITKAQSDSILQLTALFAGLLFVHGAVHTVARDRRLPEIPGRKSVELKAEATLETPKRKTGRLPAFRPAALKDFAAYATKKLPKPPVTFAAPKASYPMDGNDKYGDCTIAGVAHLIAAWNALFKQHDRVPTQKSIVTEYFKLSGGQDSGLVEANVLSTWQKIGLFGQKIAGYAPVKPSDIVGIKQAIAFYGGCYLGIQCPESAQRQFQEGKPWTFEGEETEDGHCIVGVGYTKDGLLCATWGEVVLVTWGFLQHYLDEVWVILPHELVEAGKDTFGIDTAALKTDLASV